MMVDGLQGVVSKPSFLDEEHVVATAKHFLADGGTHRGIDRGDAKISEQELVDLHAAGFLSALESGAQTIMASFNSWNGEKLHGSRYILTDVLKNRLGFDGFVVGDWNAHRFVDGCSVDSCAAAINAGLDMFMTPSDWKPLYENTLRQVKEGEIPMARVDDAVRRILRVKFRAGLFDKGPVDGRKLAGREGVMGGKKNRLLAREAVRKSLVLLKNNGKVLPIQPKANILVVGDAANDVSQQSGGWTISWQGTGNKREDFKNATTIFEGIKAQVSKAGGEANFVKSDDIDNFRFANAMGPDAIIFVYGEQPYAEWHGDIAGIEYQLGDKADLNVLKKLAKYKAPLVSVFLSGRPLWVNKELNASDAFVAAWLPGSEGAGIADVILSDSKGDVQHDFQGRLSFSWPKYVNQTVLNKGDENYDPLFPYGYGLSYASNVELSDSLNEDGGKFDFGRLDDAWVLVSRVMPPWTLFLQEKNGAEISVDGNVAVSPESKAVKVMSIDRVSQEDAREIVWSGAAEASIRFSAKSHQDFKPYLEEGSALTFEVRLDAPLNGEVELALSCGDACGANIPFSKFVDQNHLKAWQKVDIPLACLAKLGVDFTQVKTAFSLQSKDKNTLQLSNVKIVPVKDVTPMLSCSG